MRGFRRITGFRVLLARRFGAVGAVVLLASVGLALTAPATWARAFLPEPGASPNQNSTNTLYEIALIFGVVVFLAVELGLIYALVRYRARKGRVASQIRGNTRLETAWTLGAVVLVTTLTVLVFVELSNIKNPPATGPGGLPLAGDVQFASLDQPAPPGGQALRIHVNGQQYLWRYEYPNGAFSFDTLVVPLNTTVVLDIVASDVAHQWWIPRLGAAVDAIPGYTNHSWFKISQPGVYAGQCALLCGQGHANMVGRVCAVPPDQYQTWVNTQLQDIQASNKDIATTRALVAAANHGDTSLPPNALQLQAQITAPSGPDYVPSGCDTTPP